MEKEIFVDIKGFEGLYQVSNFGNVKSLERKYIGGNGCVRVIKEHFLYKGINHKGYNTVTLCKGKHRKTALIHRLVAEAFLPNTDNLPQVDHIDGNKQSNIVKNLRWVDNKTNANNPNTKWKSHRKHSDKTKEKMSVSHKGKITKQCLDASHKSHQKPVAQYKDGRLIKTYDSLSEASTNVKCCITAISKAINNRGTCRGCTWEFIF